MKRVKKKTTDNNTKWPCGKCNGDVRLPPPPSFQTSRQSSLLAAETTTSTTTEEMMVDELFTSYFSNVHHLKCALKCSTPHYHLTCTSVPKGSQIYQCAIISSEAPATTVSASDDATIDTLGGGDGGVTTSMIEQKIQQHSSSYSKNNVWWNPDNILDTKQPHRGTNQQSLPGSTSSHSNSSSKKNWPTSMLSFICPKCDVEGTSRYLLEYFERFATTKKSYYGEYLKNDKRCNSNHSVTNCRLDRVDESVDARTGETFIWHLMKDNRKDYNIHKKNMQVRLSPERNSELETINNDNYWNPSEIQLSKMAKILTTLLDQQLHSHHEKKQNKRQKSAAFQLDPSYLVGMAMRLYNPIDNSYHTGRIIDYQLNAPYAVDEPPTSTTTNVTFFNDSSDSSSTNIGSLVDKEICNTLFLIRFRHGVDNRKISVHKWIYLEEHAVTVGGEICWANVGHLADGIYIEDSNTSREECSSINNDGISKSSDEQQYISPYRPVQIVLRSLLEMIPCQNLNPLNDTLNLLAMGFGQTFSHVRLSLMGGDKQCDDKTTTSMSLQPNGDVKDTSMMHTELIPFTPNNPRWLDQFLHRAEFSDEELAVGIGMACMEKEEERRIRVRLNLSVSFINQELEKTTE